MESLERTVPPSVRRRFKSIVSPAPMNLPVIKIHLVLARLYRAAAKIVRTSRVISAIAWIARVNSSRAKLGHLSASNRGHVICSADHHVLPDRINTFSQPKRIIKTNWAVANITVEIWPRVEAPGIFAEEPASRWVVVSGAIVIEAGFGVRFAGCILEWIHKRASRSRQFAEGIVGVGICDGTSRTAQRGDGTKTIGVAVAGPALAKPRHRIVGRLHSILAAPAEAQTEMI